jgi:hypothetical protein
MTVKNKGPYKVLSANIVSFIFKIIVNINRQLIMKICLDESYKSQRSEKIRVSE